MNKDITLVVLAAGMGSRFGGLKQIEPMGPNGEFIIDYSIYDAIKAGFTKVVFIIKEENYDIFKDTIGSRVDDKIKVEYAFQNMDHLPEGFDYPEDRKKPYGTGHAILCAKEKVHENFAIISADDFFGYDAFKKAADFLKTNNDFCVVGYKIGETLSDKGSVKRGVCIEKDGYLTSVIESKVEKQDDHVHCEPLSGAESYDVPLDQPVSMLMFGFTPMLFDELETQIVTFFENNKDNMDSCEFLLPDVLDEMIKKDKVKVKVLPTTATWLGVTYKEDAPAVRESIKKLVKTKDNEEGDYPLHLWEK
jgi:dTDP-glucose pyrophosphorylase